MDIVFIGSGNLATNLGISLFHSGHNIKQVYSRTIESARILADTVNAEPTNDITSIDNNADVYIFAVKDSVISTLAEQICKHDDNKIYVHTSGSTPMDVFKGHASCYGVLYPLQTFSKERKVDFSTIPCFIETNDDSTYQTVNSLANSISENVMQLNSESRRSIHLSAVFACNFTNHCYALAAEVLKANDIPFNVLLPLIDETACKVHSLEPLQAQTGPAVRFDENIINRHLDMLSSNRQLQDIYKMMSQSIHKTANNND